MRIYNFAQTGYACPSQWEGTLEDGSNFYGRFRMGRLSIEIDNEEIYCWNSDDSWAGVMSITEFQKHLEKLDLEIGYE